VRWRERISWEYEGISSGGVGMVSRYAVEHAGRHVDLGGAQSLRLKVLA